MGALALFGEKYGEKVRAVKIYSENPERPYGESIELCGGTHVDNTSKLGQFKIISESSIAAGVRRIEAATGWGAIALIKKDKDLISETAKILKVNNPGDIAKRSEILLAEIKENKREIESLQEKLANIKIENALTQPAKLYYTFEAEQGAAKLICDKITQKYPGATVIIASVTPEKIIITAACGANAVKSGANAGNLVRQIAQITGGSGGGRPEFAVAGGKDASKLDEALEKGEEILRGMTG
jgi:alanyl-tRNA synthetase